MGIVGLVLLSVLGWSLVATASSPAAPLRAAAPALTPTCTNDSVSTAYQTPTTVTFSCTGGTGVLTYSLLSGPTHGTLGAISNQVTYTPNAGFSGQDSFQVQATDVLMQTATDTVTVTVGPHCTGNSVSTAYQTATTVAFSCTGTGLTYSLVSGPTHGTLGAISNQVTYTPTAGFSGQDSFQVLATDAAGQTATDTVTVTVGPHCTGNSVSTAYQTATTVAFSCTGTGLTYSLVSGPTHGTLGAISNQVTYTPNAGFSGPDSFQVLATDAAGQTATDTVTVTVTAPGAPTCTGNSVSTAYQTATTVTFSCTGTGLTYSLVSGPAHGTLGVITGNQVTYTPTAGFSGQDSFQVLATDAAGQTATDTVTVTVAAPGAPTVSTTVLSVVPAQPVTNQTETMSARVTASVLTPSGTVAFDNRGAAISGCGRVPLVPVATGVATATCRASFAATNSPLALTAVFTPGGVGNPAASTSPVDTMTVGQDSTSTKLKVSSAHPTTGSTVTYTAAVVPNHAGPTQPGGSVRFTKGKKPFFGCASQPLQRTSSGTATAVCHVRFRSTGTRVITAHYRGDASFTSSDSRRAKTFVHKPSPPQRVLAALQWSFFYHPTYTNVLLLLAHRVAPGATIQLKCNGQGCPYAARAIAISNSKSCQTTATVRCTKLPSTTVALLAAFLDHRLGPGTRLTVEILRPGWIGKYYRFTIRAGHRPRQLISCLAPGAIRPGVGC